MDGQDNKEVPHHGDHIPDEERGRVASGAQVGGESQEAEIRDTAGVVDPFHDPTYTDEYRRS